MGQATSTFAPMPRDERFMVVLATWQPPANCGAMAMIDAAISRKPPISYVETPDGFGCMESRDIVADRLLTAAEAVEAAAEINRAFRDDWLASKKRAPDEWAVVVELGRSKSENALTIGHDGTGVLNRNVRITVRIHKASAEAIELHRFKPPRPGPKLKKRKPARRRGDETQANAANDEVSSPEAGV